MTIAWVVAGLWFVIGVAAARRAWFGWWAIAVAAVLGAVGSFGQPSGPVLVVSLVGSAVALALAFATLSLGRRTGRMTVA